MDRYRNRGKIMADLNEFQSKIGYTFKNRHLLEQALTHSSYANEKHMKKHSDNNVKDKRSNIFPDPPVHGADDNGWPQGSHHCAGRSL